jgi:hypothetical protein
MKKILIASIAGLALVGGYAAAQSMPMGNMQEQMQGSKGSMRMMQSQMMGQSSNMKIMRDLMTPTERLAMMDKMVDARNVKERQAIMTTTHAEMEKRAKEKGITLPAGHGPQMMSGKNCG